MVCIGLTGSGPAHLTPTTFLLDILSQYLKIGEKKIIFFKFWVLSALPKHWTPHFQTCLTEITEIKKSNHLNQIISSQNTSIQYTKILVSTVIAFDISEVSIDLQTSMDLLRLWMNGIIYLTRSWCWSSSADEFLGFSLLFSPFSSPVLKPNLIEKVQLEESNNLFRMIYVSQEATFTSILSSFRLILLARSSLWTTSG